MKFEFNKLQNILYFFAPFIIVCYFLIYSIINADIKGLIYLIGLVSSTILTIFIGNGIVNKNNLKTPDTEKPMCNLFTINNFANISNVPISVTVYSFTAMYLLYTSIVLKYVLPNLLPLVFFGILILSDIIWLRTNDCFTGGNIAVAFIIPTILGLGWGYIVNLTNNKSWQYFTGDSNTCTIPKHKYFKCKKGDIPT
jgi:hypothetical protein